MSALFLVMALVVGVTGPVVLVVFARAVSVILTDTKTIDTVLSAMKGFVGGTAAGGNPPGDNPGDPHARGDPETGAVLVPVG